MTGISEQPHLSDRDALRDTPSRDMPSQTDVLIVGLGPVGAALANILGSYGLNVVVIDKALDIFAAPRAIALDNEALRVLQMCGVGEHDIDTVAIPEVRMHSPHFGQYGRAVTAGSIDGHPKLVTFYQPQLEQVLRRRLNGLPSVHVALGCELVSFRQDDAAVVADVGMPDSAVRRITATYIVGADGANSLVRRLMDQEFKGKTYAEDWLVVDAKRVSQAIDHVEFICDPLRPTPHMVAPGDRQRWEFKLQPGETREQMEHPDMVRRLLHPWTNGQDIEIERVAVYRFHARLAEKFQVGRAFLVGDAAHITPPFVGQGLVAGLRDVANLGWKLAWVVQRKARPDLLNSYTQERRPHVKAMIDLAKMMGNLVMPGNAVAAFLIHGAMKAMAQVPRLRRLFENLEIKPANRYQVGCFVRRDRIARLYRGGQLPQAWVRNVQGGEVVLSDDAIGAHFVMIGFGVDPTKGITAAQKQAWRALGGQFVQINPRGRAAVASAAAVWEDLAGALMPCAVPVGWVAVVRPDKMVMNDGPLADATAVLQSAIQLFSPEEAQPFQALGLGV